MKYLYYYIFFSLIFFSFINSYMIGNLQLSINNNSFIKSIVFINILTSVFGPTLYLTLLLLGSKFMFFYFDIEIKNSEIMNLLLKSLYPTLLVLIFVSFIVFLNYSSLKSLKTIEEINNFEILFNLTLIELKTLYNLSWFFLYPLLIFEIMDMKKLTFTKSLAISTLPSLIFFIFKFLFIYV